MLYHEKIGEFLLTVAKAPLSALLLDYDGTLAPFSVDRDHATPYPGVSDLLKKISDSERTKLVVITGRDAREVGPLLGLHPAPEIWGSHGLQRLRPNGTCEMPVIPPRAAQALHAARRWLAYQDLQHLAEIKPGSIAIHWRVLNETAACELRSRILLGWFPIADGGSLRLLEFDGGVEMRFAEFDKGDAVKAVLREVGREVPVAYLGDDATDERAFQALNNRGLTVLVRPNPRQTSAQVWLRAPEELLKFLSCWARATSLATPSSPQNCYQITTRHHGCH
jgi:trehalose 6-phosphate phosphatase